MDNKLNKSKSLGVLCDITLDRYMERLGLNKGLSVLVNILFFLFLWAYVSLGFFVVHPNLSFEGTAMAGNQIAIDGVFFGGFALLLLPFIGFFLMLNGAAAVVVCGENQPNLSQALKALARKSLGIFSLALAQTLLFMLAFGIFGVIAFFNLDLFLTLTPIFIGVLVVVLIIVRSMSFFSVNLVITHQKYFFGAIFASGKMVLKGGFIKVFVVVLVVTMVNLFMYGIIFLIVHQLLSPMPINDIGTFLSPNFYTLLLVAYIPMIFISPRMDTIAQSFLSPPDIFPHQAGLGSRTLAFAVDLLIPATVKVALVIIFILLTNLNFEDGLHLGIGIIWGIAFFFIFVMYNIYFEVFEKGQTPGKKLLNLRVVSEDGSPITLMKSILRNILRIVDIVSFVLILFDKNHHRLGDVLSYTKVITEDRELDDENV